MRNIKEGNGILGSQVSSGDDEGVRRGKPTIEGQRATNYSPEK